MGIYSTQPEPYYFKGMFLSSIGGEAVLTTTYMINRIPPRLLDNKSLVEILKSSIHTLEPQMGSLLGYLGALHLFMSTANIETS